MKITLTPIIAELVADFRVSGESLWINATEFDLSVVPEGERVWSGWLQSPLIVGYVGRFNGEIEVSLLQPVQPDAWFEVHDIVVVDGWPE